jgi:hypothetical protein
MSRNLAAIDNSRWKTVDETLHEFDPEPDIRTVDL